MRALSVLWTQCVDHWSVILGLHPAFFAAPLRNHSNSLRFSSNKAAAPTSAIFIRIAHESRFFQKNMSFVNFTPLCNLEAVSNPSPHFYGHTWFVQGNMKCVQLVCSEKIATNKPTSLNKVNTIVLTPFTYYYLIPEYISTFIICATLQTEPYLLYQLDWQSLIILISASYSSGVKVPSQRPCHPQGALWIQVWALVAPLLQFNGLCGWRGNVPVSLSLPAESRVSLLSGHTCCRSQPAVH